MQTRIADGKVTLKTRTGLDWTHKFGAVANACAALDGHDVILDGEIASIDESGVSDFSALQDDLKTGREDRLAYYVFDLLYLDGQDLTGSPLIERKRALAALLAELPQDGVVKLSEHFEQDGPTLLKHACSLHLEGIVSKRADAPYRSGRGGDWLKTKCSSNQELIVIGYEPSDKKGRLIRSLLLGYYDKDGLRYAGRVGTGWGQAEERDLQRKLDAVARKDTALDKIPPEERRRGVKWVEPEIVVEVDFRGWTGSQLVRQGSLKGVRQDKPAKQVVREVEQMPETATRKQAALRQKSPAKTGKAGSAKASGPGCRCRAEPSRPGLLGRRRRHQTDAGGILHGGLGLDATACDGPGAGAGALPRRRQRAVLLPEARIGGHRRQAFAERAGRRRQVDRGR